MVSHRTRGLQTSILLCEAGLAVGALCLVAWFVSVAVTEITVPQWGRLPIYAVMIVGGLTLESMSRSQRRPGWRTGLTGYVELHRLAFVQTAYAAGALLAYLVVAKDQYISRSLLIAYVPILYATLFWAKTWLPRRLARGIFGSLREERTLLIGPKAKVPRLKDWLAAKEDFGFRTMGFLTAEEPGVGRVSEIACLGGLADLETVVRRDGITQIIVLELPREAARHREFVSTAERLGVRFMIMSDLEEMLDHPVVMVEDDGLRFITLREEPLENPLNRILKRTLDLFVAVPVVMVVLPPLAVLVWLLQRFQSPGPLFYTQTRAGLQNRHFQIIKFRTMHVRHGEESRQATRNDGRVFPAGRWLRRFSIDELPQFVNVLRGDMSVTGPRPHLTEHNALFAAQLANYHIRTLVTPGITGLAQVRGFRGEARTAAEIAHRLASDLSYLENWRLVLDLSIIVRTVWQMLRPPGSAY
jgi:putative colanic acid biosynthesis UDP-glucose lipid carrier transferase